MDGSSIGAVATIVCTLYALYNAMKFSKMTQKKDKQ